MWGGPLGPRRVKVARQAGYGSGRRPTRPGLAQFKYALSLNR
jgi:hypothetical protein